MKKTLSLLLILVLLVGCVSIMTSCAGNLSGTYKSEYGKSYSFNIFNTIITYADGDKQTVSSHLSELDENGCGTITITYNAGESIKIVDHYDFKKISDTQIKIDGIVYTKVD